MIRVIYNIGMWGLAVALKIVSPWHTKAQKMIKGHRDTWGKIKNMPSSTRKAWVHCASLGEFEQARPLIEAYKAKHPDHFLLLSFFSPSGYEVRKDYDGADLVVYLPIDSAKNATRFLDLTSPDLIFFIKYEFWYHYLTQAHARNIPLYGVSVIFRPSQHFFKWYGKGFFRKILHSFTHFFLQNNESKELLEGIGIKAVQVTGDTRFDRVAQIANTAEPLPLVEAFKDNKALLVLGSAWEKDQEIVTQLIKNHDTKVIIAPHEIHPNDIDQYLNTLSKSGIKYSQIDKDTDLKSMQVLVIDNIGMLTSIYRYADFAFVGGAFGDGLHNILEPATFGMPIFFGNTNYKKYQEALDLIDLEVAFAVGDYKSFEQCFSSMPLGSSNYQKTKDTCLQYVQKNIGSTEKIMKRIG